MVAQQQGPRGRLLFDVMLAVVLFVGESVLWVLQPPQYQPSTWLWPVVWLALGYVAVALRRTAVHWAVAILVVNLSVAAIIRDWGGSGASLIVLTYTIAASCSLRYTIGTSVLLWLGPLALALTPLGLSRSDPIPVDLPVAYYVAYNVLLFLLIFFIGRTVHNRRAYVSALEDRARTAERGQLAIAEQAVADERRRIARELHDVVAHHVSVMSVLATGTRRALSRDPVAADEALATIEETGRVALREMRRLLVVLRTDTEPAGELEPQPGLPGLDGLIEQVREAGLPVQLTTFGDPGHLDPGVALAVYRITQEALTNALKHAGPASAEVRLSFAARELAIEISDTGRGPRPGPRTVGHGLLGMRERISLYGGSLRAGPRPGGGFRVFARIPLEGEQGDRPTSGETAEKADTVEKADPTSYQGATGDEVGAVPVTLNNGKDPV
ncbi:sensor histidine kinase [Virgisporangium ochraceum]|uniref:histidine kinase n=1 Tax=Virgisporangium ochraceum TaxID=65505 RepID=A0A8J4A6G8_9ACTN|nr:sensor histidine kinase [Virgisporangium ochraceum]GIJ74745.1 two-component sensor histidine kinase [Virgisporangium ochraceum]